MEKSIEYFYTVRNWYDGLPGFTFLRNPETDEPWSSIEEIEDFLRTETRPGNPIAYKFEYTVGSQYTFRRA